MKDNLLRIVEKVLVFVLQGKLMNSGCYTVVRRYEFYVRLVRTIQYRSELSEPKTHVLNEPLTP